MRRVLRPGGTLAVYLERADAAAQAEVTAALAPSFPAIEWLALSPWQGLTIAPVADADASARRQAIFSDDLLAAAPRPAALLALASVEARPSEAECVLLALPQGDQPVAPILSDRSAGAERSAASDDAALAEARAEEEIAAEVVAVAVAAAAAQADEAEAAAASAEQAREVEVAAREAALDERAEAFERRLAELRALERTLGEREALIIAAQTGASGRPRGAAAPAKETGGDASEEVVALRKKVASLTIRAESADRRATALTVREEAQRQREAGLEAAEEKLALRFEAAKMRASALDTREAELAERDAGLAVRREELDAWQAAVAGAEAAIGGRLAEVSARSKELDEREASVATKDAEIAAREAAIAAREAAIAAEEAAAAAKQAKADADTEAAAERQREAAERTAAAQREVDALAEAAAQRRRELDAEAAAEAQAREDRLEARIAAAEAEAGARREAIAAALAEAAAEAEVKRAAIDADVAAAVAEAQAKRKEIEAEIADFEGAAEAKWAAIEESVESAQEAADRRRTELLDEAASRRAEIVEIEAEAEHRIAEAEAESAAVEAAARQRMTDAEVKAERAAAELLVASERLAEAESRAAEADLRLAALEARDGELSRREEALRAAEASGEAVVDAATLAELAELRDRLAEAEAELAAKRGGAATSGASEEEGQVGADVALDRDRLREELARRSAALQESEEKLWQANEAAQKERIENVRLVAEVDRLREQVERSRGVERDRVKEIEGLGHELRRLEVAHAELQGLLESKAQRIRELEASAGGDAVDADAASLQAKLRETLTELERSRSREQARVELARRREREVIDAQETITQLRRTVDDYAATAANLRGELVVIQVEVEQLQTQVPGLQQQITELRRKLRAREDEGAGLQQKLESAALEQQHLRKRLRERKREHEALLLERDGLTAEAEGLRAELEAVKQAMGQLGSAASAADADTGLHDALAIQARRFADELERIEARRESLLKVAQAKRERAELEASVRAEEQEFLLFRLDTAEQRIWEMTDASDRSAARLAAGLAQYAKQKEQLEDLVHELEVTRDMLAEAESRVAELERNLASERARLARQGLDAGAIALPDVDVEPWESAEPWRGEPDPVATSIAELGPAETVDEVFTPGEFEDPLHLDDELLRMTDAILDGDVELVQPMVHAPRTDDEYDRELDEILAAGDLSAMPSLSLAGEVDDELMMDVEAAMATSRAKEVEVEAGGAIVEEVDEPWPEPAAEAEASAEESDDDTGIIIEMLDDDEAWPDDPWGQGVGGGPQLISTDTGTSDEYIDIDLFDDALDGPAPRSADEIEIDVEAIGASAVVDVDVEDEADEADEAAPERSVAEDSTAAPAEESAAVELGAAALRALGGKTSPATVLETDDDDAGDDGDFEDVFADMEMPMLVTSGGERSAVEIPSAVHPAPSASATRDEVAEVAPEPDEPLVGDASEPAPEPVAEAAPAVEADAVEADAVDVTISMIEEDLDLAEVEEVVEVDTPTPRERVVSGPARTLPAAPKPASATPRAPPKPPVAPRPPLPRLKLPPLGRREPEPEPELVSAPAVAVDAGADAASEPVAEVIEIEVEAPTRRAAPRPAPKRPAAHEVEVELDGFEELEIDMTIEEPAAPADELIIDIDFGEPIDEVEVDVGAAAPAGPRAEEVEVELDPASASGIYIASPLELELPEDEDEDGDALLAPPMRDLSAPGGREDAPEGAAPAGEEGAPVPLTVGIPLDDDDDV
ncbi:MAG: hypothetical protein R3A79_03015 [Nannocystaceae bacterium]